MKKLFLSAAALIVLFAACSKDDDNNIPNNPDNSQTPPKLHQSTVSATDSFQSVYDVDYNLVKTVYWDSKGAIRSTDSMVYENGKLAKIMSGRAGTTVLRQTLEYNSAGKLAKVGYYFSNDNSLSSYDSIVYNADGRPAASYNKLEDSRLGSKKVFTWDSKGNLAREIRIEYSEGIELKDTSIIDNTYDDKVNFGAKQAVTFLLEPEGVGFAFSVNNVVKSLRWHTAIPGRATLVTYEYTYDKDGYAASRKDTGRPIENGQEGPISYEDAFWFHYTR
jgi:hypothetical protein